VNRKQITTVAVMMRVQLAIADTDRERELVARIARNLASTFSQVNSSFAFHRFYIDCGLEPDGNTPLITQADVGTRTAAIKRVNR
jgi:hypothetical protein